jgi:hypothetical protein
MLSGNIYFFSVSIEPLDQEIVTCPKFNSHFTIAAAHMDDQTARNA